MLTNIAREPEKPIASGLLQKLSCGYFKKREFGGELPARADLLVSKTDTFKTLYERVGEN
jgi:hypothetical protein